MPALAIVEPLNIVKDSTACGREGEKGRLPQLSLERGKAALHRRVVVAIAPPAHARFGQGLAALLDSACASRERA